MFNPLVALYLIFAFCFRYLGASENFYPRILSKTLSPFDRLTFITVPHEFNTSENIYQYLLPFRSWLSASPNGEIIIFGKASNNSFDIVISTLNSEYPYASITFHEIELGIDNRPLIKDWFVRGAALATSEIAIFLNADLLVEYDFNMRIQKVYQQVKNYKFLLMIDRTMTKVIKPIDHHLDVNEYNNYLKITKEHGIMGCDIFIINPKRSPFDLTFFPPFVVGLPAWDNCLIGNAMRNNAATFGLDSFVSVFHIEHKKIWDAKKRSDKMRNLTRIVNQYFSKCQNNFIHDAYFKFKKNGAYSSRARRKFNHPLYFI